MSDASGIKEAKDCKIDLVRKYKMILNGSLKSSEHQNHVVERMKLKVCESLKLTDISNYTFDWPYIAFSDYKGWIYVVNCYLKHLVRRFRHS